MVLASARWLAPPSLVPEAVAQQTSVVRLPKFLTSDDIERLLAAAAEVREDLELAGKVGLHDLAKRQSSPKQTWETVFLNHRLVELLPELHERLFTAARHADAQEGWKLLEAGGHPLSFRVVELHSVRPGGALALPTHYDYGSLITLDLMLSNPGEDFNGGRLQTLESDGSVLSHPFERGDLVMFQSHKYHSVTPVKWGTRRVCVLEIWEGLPRRCPRRCTTPWGPCTCQFATRPPVYRARGGSESFVPSSMLRLLREAARANPE